MFVAISIADVDLAARRIRLTQGTRARDRHVPFGTAFSETLAPHIDRQRTKHA